MYVILFDKSTKSEIKVKADSFYPKNDNCWTLNYGNAQYDIKTIRFVFRGVIADTQLSIVEPSTLFK